MASPPDPRTRWRTALPWVLLLVLYAVLRVPALTTWAPTYDEPIYIAAGRHFAVHGDGSIAAFLYHPPLAYHLTSLPLTFLDVPLPAWDPAGSNVQLGLEALYGSRTGAGAPVAPDTVLLLARFPVFVVGFIGAVLLRALGRRIGGERAGWIAAIAWVVYPDGAAQSVQATTDCVAAVAAFGLALAAIRHHEAVRAGSPGRATAAVLGAAIGLALLAKHTLLVHVAVTAAALVAAAFLARRARPQSANHAFRAAAGRGALAAAAAVATLWAGYLFETAPLLRGPGDVGAEKIARVLGISAETARDVFGSVPLPAPTYLRSVADALTDKALARGGTLWQAYLSGEWSDRGFLSYFFVATLVKTPVALLAGLAAGLVVVLRLAAGRSSDAAAVRSRLGFAAVLCAALFVVPFAAAVTSRLNIGVRHLLPTLPFLFPLAAAGLCLPLRSAPGAPPRPLLGALGGGALMLLLAVEWLPARSDPMAFANRLAGGPDRLHERLADSNLEMGQDLWAVLRFAETRQAGRVIPLLHTPVGVTEREAARRPDGFVRVGGLGGGEILWISGKEIRPGRNAPPDPTIRPGVTLVAIGESVLVLPRLAALRTVEPSATVGRTRIYVLPE